jgi:hypothetical protein
MNIHPLSIQHGQFLHKREDFYCPPIQNPTETISDLIKHLRFLFNVADQVGIRDIHA